MTVRDMLAEIQTELRTDDVPPTRARELAIKLAALLGNVNAEVRDAEMAYNAARLALLNSSDKASHAKMRAEATPEYARLRIARDTKESVKAMRSTLNTVIRSMSDEMRLA